MEDVYVLDAPAGGILRISIAYDGNTIDYALTLGVAPYEQYINHGIDVAIYRGDPIKAEWLLEESNTYVLYIHPTTAGPGFYSISGDLITDEPTVLSVSPTNVTTNVPAQFSAEVPGGDNAAYSWNFGAGALPQTSSLRNPTISNSLPGMHTGVVRVQTAGPETVHSFTYYVSEWKRSVVFADDSDCIRAGLTVNSDGIAFVGSTSESSPLMYLSGGVWIPDTSYPGIYAIREDSIAVNGLGEPAISYSLHSTAFGIMEQSSGVWNDQVLDAGYDGYGSFLLADSSGNLRAIYLRQLGSDESGIRTVYYAEQNSGIWNIQQVGKMAGGHTNPCLALDSEGHPYIAYVEWKQWIGTAMTLAHWDGAIWTYEQVLASNENHNLDGTALLSVDAYDNPHLYYNEIEPISIKHRWKDSEWHTEIIYTPAEPVWLSNWTLATDSQHEPWMVLYSRKDTNMHGQEIGLLHHEASGWDYELIAHDTNIYFAGDLALDSNDKPRFVYYDRDTLCLMYAWRD
jgi:PKD repeat protein